MASTLVRPRRGKVIAGVCAAVADRLGLSRTLVRTESDDALAPESLPALGDRSHAVGPELQGSD